jgi:2-polyprenyl-6-methoxyphenol hydroxylase-like FAD-dependent oxidoreductase
MPSKYSFGDWKFRYAPCFFGFPYDGQMHEPFSRVDWVPKPEIAMGRTHAVVIGGSFSGLAAGRVLSEFCDRVTVLDRDKFPERIEDRAGVPQARHVHGLLVRGLIEYEKLFPGFERLAVAKGATFHDHTLDFAVLRPQGWQPRYRSGLKFLSASRELIESCMRELFRQIPNVELRERTAATGLHVQRNRQRCGGVLIPSGALGHTEIIEADLVVDASGSVSRAPMWLEQAGITPPRETVVDPLAGYSSRWFKGPAQWPEDWWWWAGAYVRRRPDDLVEANFQLKEHNRWHLTLSGFNRHYPPTRESDFMEALKRLRSPLIAEMTRLMEPISPVYANRAIRNRWRHYERWNQRCEGFLAIGDAYVTYNPVYAQGMTAAAISAQMLRSCLDRYGPSSPELPRAYHIAQAAIQHDPWLLSAGVDLRFPFTTGQKPVAIRLFNLYLDGVGLAARADPAVRRTLIEVAQLVRPLSDLFHAGVATRVGMAALAAGLGRIKSLHQRASAIPPMPPAATDAERRPNPKPRTAALS